MKRVKVKDLAQNGVVPTELLFGRVFSEDKNPSGRLAKSFRLGGVTGKARQRILQESQGKTDIELLTNIVFVLAEEVGGVPVGNKQVIQKMTTYDRDWMLLAGALTENPTQDVKGACRVPGCSGKVELDEFHLNELDVRVPEDKDFVRQGGYWTWLDKVPGPGGKEAAVTFRLRTVEDDEEAFRGARAKVPLGSLAYTLSTVIVDFGGRKLSEDEVLSLPGKTLDALAESLNAKEFGADTTLDVECPSCGESILMGVDVVSYFFGSSRKKEREKE